MAKYKDNQFEEKKPFSSNQIGKKYLYKGSGIAKKHPLLSLGEAKSLYSPRRGGCLA